ncbi:MAG: hypothetical protein AVDCRST_MAG49-3675 [uncultured Thermomicrobiales bacterium]|uniref:Uncharacterized protein n=1 Tax=uncultured Thermomicrobiales bacterium TaxID=1645740 RepID=A0A6J4VEA7_9BACT|nr:MAG: hypothetical protein AVDCRST_MAG49-3675 [uncultured Thermomicrobiales bacterium]
MIARPRLAGGPRAADLADPVRGTSARGGTVAQTDSSGGRRDDGAGHGAGPAPC